MKKQALCFYLVISFLCAYPFNPLIAQQKELDELLDLSLEELTKIQVITVSKIPQKIKEVPAAVRIITAEQIKNNGYMTLEEALSDLPGMQFRNINGFNSYVFMRGVPNQNNLILVLIDGIHINELNSGGFYAGAQYNLANVDRIEVVYGPASALYGTNAVSGIINIITKKADKHTGVELNTVYGTFDTVNTDLSYGYWDDKKKLGLRISGMYKTSQKADLAGKAGDDNWTENLENFENDISVDAKLIWKNFDLGFNYLNKQSSTATANKSVGTIYHDTDTLWNIRFINAYLKHNIQLGEKTGLSSRLYYRNATVMDNSVKEVTDTGQIGYYRPNDLFGLESLMNHSIGKRWNTILGIVFEKENLAKEYSNTYSTAYNIKPPPPEKPDMEHNTLLSFYGQLKTILSQSIELYAGARYDNSSVYDKVLTPRLGLVYNKNLLTAKLLYTEAFRAPKPWDYTNGIGNPDLKPEEMSSFELNAGYLFMPCLRLDLSVYKNQFKNLFVKELTTDSWRWINHGTLDTTGLELGLEYKKQGIQSYVNYSLNHSIDENDMMIPEIGKHQFNLGLQYSFSDKFRCNIRGNYIGKRKNTRVITTTGSEYADAAFVVHSAITYSLGKHFDIQIAIKNMFDAEYYHTSNLMPDRYRQPQRTFLIRATYQLK